MSAAHFNTLRSYADNKKNKIIFDSRVTVDHVHEPADYPRQQAQDIGRPVERADMTKFLVDFMATDQLGRIATIHMALADQKDDGTFDPECVSLASPNCLVLI